MAATPKDGAKNQLELTQRVDEKDANEDSDRARKSNRIVRTDTYETRNLKLSKHEANEGKCTVESNKGPKPSKLTPADEVSLSLRTPK